MCALQWALMVTLPMTLVFERKQYQPLGFMSRMVVPPITLSAESISTSSGSLVGARSSVFWPMPKTFTTEEYFR